MRYGDNPVLDLDQDQLDRQSAVGAVLNLLEDVQLDTPIALGIFGEWGSGKTSVMKMLHSNLDAEHLKIWFDAWHYGKQEDTLWRALMMSVIECLRGQVDRVANETASASADVAARKEALTGELDQLSVALYRSHEYQQQGGLKFNWQAAIPFAIQTAFAFVPAGKNIFDNVKAWFSKDGQAEEVMRLVEREQTSTYRQQIQSLEQFQTTLRTLLPQYLRVAPDGDRKLFIFVDDLDRCLPEAAVSALEALKVFLDVSGCVFVLGMDRRVVEQGIYVRYQTSSVGSHAQVPPISVVDASQYLDKIIQIPFTLPPLSEHQIQGLIRAWIEDHADDGVLEQCADVIIAGVSANPRRVKRTLNVLRLVRALRSQTPSSADELQAEVERLAKLVVLQTSYPDVYESVVEDVTALKALEAAALNPTEDLNGKGSKSMPARLAKMLSLGGRFTEMEDRDLAALMYVAQASHAPTERLSTASSA